MFDAVEIGTSISSSNDAFQNRFGKLSDEEMDRQVKPFIEGIKWSEVAVKLYSSYQQNNKDKQKIVEVTGREG